MPAYIGGPTASPLKCEAAHPTPGITEFISKDPEFGVSWLLGIAPASRPTISWPYHEFETSDPSFSVSWLLGLKSDVQQMGALEWASQYHSSDPHFRVSWLLGLEATTRQSSQRPAWADQYETEEASFTVSALLGLEPWPTSEVMEESHDAEAPVESMDAQTKENELEESKSEDDAEENKDEVEEAEAQNEDQNEDSEETEEEEGEETAFLEISGALEHLLDEIEAANDKAEADKTKADADDNESIDGLDAEECEDDDPSRIEWLRQKKIEFAENKHIDRLMSLPGLVDTKAFFLRAKAKFQAASRRETSLRKGDFHVIFNGNQGTGKSLVSRLYAKYLLSMGLVKPTEEYTGIYMASGFKIGTTGVTDTLNEIKAQADCCGGCIVIIEDAHHIDDRPWNLWRIYRDLMTRSDKIVFILNAERGEGLSKVLRTNAQLRSDLPIIDIPNYTEDQLRKAFEGWLRVNFKNRMGVEGGMDGLFMKIFLQRLMRNTTKENFTNMWALRKAFLEACRRQVDRFKQARREGIYPEDYHMTKEDLLGKKPDMAPEKSSAWKELQSLVGLDEVKEAILSVVHQVNENYNREMKGQDMLPISANRLFLGSPGTGKTTVAKLYARILVDFGLLSKNKVVVKSSADLLDRYIGGSENNTTDALEEASGGVLIIDEAHMMDPGKNGNDDKNGDFRGGMLDTLVASITGEPGEDRCVILCGYESEMKTMFQNGNPGLGRRFPMDSAFVFPDFSPEMLGKILDLKAEKQKTPMTEKAREVAMEMLKRASVRPNFGNGGEVDNILSKGSMARSKRLISKVKAGEAELDQAPIEPEDFDQDWERFSHAASSTRDLFKDFVGCEDIISKFESYQYIAQGMRLRNIDPRPYIPFTFVFKGPPGTGKTTTARKLGQIFYDMGFLAAPDVVEVSSSQMIAEYCGQTGPKTARLLESALGKVLFVDEAYRLADGKFAEEAVSELVDAVTKEKFKQKLIIVLAGYEEDMDRLMKCNQGMRSRFATELVFKPMKGEQCLDQLRRHVSKVGIEIQATTAMETATRNDLLGGLSRMTRDKDWASGRSVETLGDKVIGHIFKECALKGYTGAELAVSGRELLRIIGVGGLKNGVSLRAGGRTGFGASQVMTLKDLGLGGE